MKQTEALKHEINLVLTDPDTNLSHGARRALDYVLGQLGVLTQPEQYAKGYADAMNWKTANHLEHLPAAQPEQEPNSVTYKEVTEAMNALYMGDSKQVQMAMTMESKKLYTTPPQRTWVGLTSEETLDWLAQQHFDQCREERPIQDWMRKMKSQLPAQPKHIAVCIGYWNQKTGAYYKPDQISASHQKLIEDGILRRCYTSPPQPKEPEQEPVAYFNPQVKGGFYWAKLTKITAPVTVSVEPMPLYTTPPQRTWVGLTNDEKRTIVTNNRSSSGAMVDTITKLREKNT